MIKMQIIVPMSGFGKRFLNAGYKIPKPLIIVDNKPIICHVIDLYPRESNVLFICNEDHLQNKTFKMKEIILDYLPTAKIFSIQAHKKGPIHAILEIKSEINKNNPTVVNYCDFSCYWNWNNFKEYTETSNCDGIIPAYKGFHPHSLNNANYAFIKNDGSKIIDIQEKQPFTSCKMNEFASSGTYYFKSGALMLDSFEYVKKKI